MVFLRQIIPYHEWARRNNFFGWGPSTTFQNLFRIIRAWNDIGAKWTIVRAETIFRLNKGGTV